MIRMMRDSTFAVGDVLSRSWQLLKSRYFSIAGLCFALFLTSNTSGILAFYLNDLNPALSVFMATLFVFAYFGIQLTLFNFLIGLIGQEKQISLSEKIPGTIVILKFFAAMLMVAFSLLIFYLLVSVAAWPLIYVGGIGLIMEINLYLVALLSFYFLLRIAFFPFFILDRDSSPWQSIRLSMALTKGNLTKLLSIIVFFVILHLLYVYCNMMGYPIISTVLSLINSFFVVPLSSVVIAMAYKDMMKGVVK